MSINPFGGETRTKSWTVIMLLLFCLGLVALAVPLSMLEVGIAAFVLNKQVILPSEQSLLQLAGAFAFTVAALSLLAWWKTASLDSSGGDGIALNLRGSYVPPDTLIPSERKLRNVVEEVAIAAGLPVPSVYLLNYEQGINAFAAGFNRHSAALGATRGAVELLSRSELQGMAAHEMSHIDNGDMRLNTRLLGYVFALTLVYSIGSLLEPSRIIAFTYEEQPAEIQMATAKEIGPIPALRTIVMWFMCVVWVLVGLPLMIIGLGGALFANFIKAWLCRDREYLADTMAVRYTRDPAGIAGALMKIGGYNRGSRVRHAAAAHMSHMFFDSSDQGWFASLLSTHPPLVKRIRRLVPHFSEPFPLVDEKTRQQVAAEDLGAMFAMSQPEVELVGLVVAGHAGNIPLPTVPYARSIIASLPPAVSGAACKPESAAALVLALLIEHDPRQNQDLLELLKEIADTPTHDRVAELLPEIAAVRDYARLPVIDLCIPALREMTPERHQELSFLIQQLIVADNRMDLMEWALLTMLKRHLDGHFKPVQRKRRLMITTLEAVRQECAVLLSVLAKLGRPDTADRQRAFAAGVKALGLDGLPLPDKSEQTLTAVDKALKRLNELDGPYKDILLRACALCVTADQEVTVKQGELLRVVADSLGCPMPPFLPGQKLTQEPQP